MATSYSYIDYITYFKTNNLSFELNWQGETCH